MSCFITFCLAAPFFFFFFFNDTATTEIYTLSLHDALPILTLATAVDYRWSVQPQVLVPIALMGGDRRSEEHTSELQSRVDLVCRLLLEKKKKKCHARRAAAAERAH